MKTKIGKVHIEVMKYLSENGAKGGRIGGRSKSEKKLASSLANLEKIKQIKKRKEAAK